jgi:hypothetical protein
VPRVCGVELQEKLSFQNYRGADWLNPPARLQKRPPFSLVASVLIETPKFGLLFEVRRYSTYAMAQLVSCEMLPLGISVVAVRSRLRIILPSAWPQFQSGSHPRAQPINARHILAALLVNSQII